MKNVYVIICEPDGPPVKVMVYGNKKSAEEGVKKIIMGELKDRGFDDPECPEYYELYEEIVNAFKKGYIKKGIGHWNDLPDAIGNSYKHTYIRLLKCSVVCKEEE